MAQAWVTGPCHFYVGVLSGTPLYLGTTEGRPYEDDQPGWEELMNDVGGSQIPYDVSYQQGELYFGGVFTRFRRDAFERIKTRPRSGGAPGGPGIPGTAGTGDVGTLMLTEGQAYNCWVVNAYGVGSLAPKAAYAASPFGVMPGGVRYIASWLHKYKDEKGVTPNRITLLFRSIPVYNPFTLGSTTYDYSISGLPVPD